GGIQVVQTAVAARGVAQTASERQRVGQVIVEQRVGAPARHARKVLAFQRWVDGVAGDARVGPGQVEAQIEGVEEEAVQVGGQLYSAGLHFVHRQEGAQRNAARQAGGLCLDHVAHGLMVEVERE